MRLNILIVDDEPKVLRGLRTIIERSNEDWNIAGEYKNGVEALAAIINQCPDVVITDIKMPCMDGLELVERARSIAPELKFIILSGFPDFSYAQQALRLETVDYILKPPDFRDILKSLKKVEQLLDEKENKMKEEEALKTFKKTALLQLKDRLFMELLYKSDTNNLLPDKGNEGELECFYSQYALFIIKMDNFSFSVFNESGNELEKLAAFRKGVQASIYKRAGCVVDLYDGTFCCMLNVANSSPVFLKGMAREIHSELKNYAADLTIGISSVHNKPEKINMAYRECLYILRNKVFYEKDSIIIFCELKMESSSEGYPLDMEHKYIEALRFANFEKAAEILKELIEKVVAISNRDPIRFKSLIMEFLIVVVRNLSEEQHTEKLKSSMSGGIYNKLNLMDNINDIKSLLLDYTKNIVDYFSEKNKPGCRKVINDIKNYVNCNYFNDISLRQISSEFFMNESYLSDLFKKETGVSFSSYLTRVRIEQAKTLLKQVDLKPHDISEMVGYSNSRYFNKVFKKYMGVTPFEYRERILNNE
jgi:two-component system, response regulator YesN